MKWFSDEMQIFVEKLKRAHNEILFHWDTQTLTLLFLIFFCTDNLLHLYEISNLFFIIQRISGNRNDFEAYVDFPVLPFNNFNSALICVFCANRRLMRVATP